MTRAEPRLSGEPKFCCIVCGSDDWCGCEDRIYCKRCCKTIKESCEAEDSSL